MKIYLNQLGIICPLGDARDDIKRRLLELAQSGLSLSDQYSPGRSLALGRVTGALPLPGDDEFPLRHRSRNNRLLLGALRQVRAGVDEAIERYAGWASPEDPEGFIAQALEDIEYKEREPKARGCRPVGRRDQRHGVPGPERRDGPDERGHLPAERRSGP